MGAREELEDGRQAPHPMRLRALRAGKSASAEHEPKLAERHFNTALTYSRTLPEVLDVARNAATFRAFRTASLAYTRAARLAQSAEAARIVLQSAEQCRIRTAAHEAFRRAVTLAATPKDIAMVLASETARTNPEAADLARRRQADLLRTSRTRPMPRHFGA